MHGPYNAKCLYYLRVIILGFKGLKHEKTTMKLWRLKYVCSSEHTSIKALKVVCFFLCDGNLFYRLPYVTESSVSRTTRLVTAEIVPQEFL
jgi:hypothetical protein